MKRYRDYPPNVPRKLIKAFRAVGSNVRKLEGQLNVNSYYICKLLNDGIEPTDKTEHGQEMRVKLFLRKLKPKPRKERKPIPDWKKKWREVMKQIDALTNERVTG